MSLCHPFHERLHRGIVEVSPHEGVESNLVTVVFPVQAVALRGRERIGPEQFDVFLDRITPVLEEG